VLRIRCPFCGERDEADFRYGGEHGAARPAAAVSNDDWADYLFNRENVRGIAYERWCHHFGCGRWFCIARDTSTNKIHAVYDISGEKPKWADS